MLSRGLAFLMSSGPSYSCGPRAAGAMRLGGPPRLALRGGAFGPGPLRRRLGSNGCFLANASEQAVVQLESVDGTLSPDRKAVIIPAGTERQVPHPTVGRIRRLLDSDDLLIARDLVTGELLGADPLPRPAASCSWPLGPAE